jgi:hypothetical protein
MKCLDPQYTNLPKTEIRIQTLIEIAREYHLQLPSHDPAELDKNVKVLDRMRNLNAVLEAFAIFQERITSLQVAWRMIAVLKSCATLPTLIKLTVFCV